MDRRQTGHRVGQVLMGIGRRVRPLVPVAVRRWMEHRFFGAVFEVTRVTNDHYGQHIESSAARDVQNG